MDGERPKNCSGRTAGILPALREAGIDNLWDLADGEGFYVKDGDWRNWLPERYGLTDPGTGLVTNLDGKPSAQVHQENRFGSLNLQWKRMMIEKGWPYNS